MVLLFGVLALKIVKLDQVRQGSRFLVSVLPVLFVASVVNLIGCWDLVKDQLLLLTAIVLVTTVATFAVAEWVTQALAGKKGGDDDE